MSEKERSRSWCFTLNNYTLEDETLIQSIPHKYLVYGREVAPTTGTIHLQGYILFENAQRFSTVRSYFVNCTSQPHIEKSKGNATQNKIYCTKDNDCYEHGDIPLTNEEKGKLEKERWEKAKSNAINGTLDLIDADIYIRCYGALKHIKRDHIQKVNDAESTTGIWIHGPAGCGKSRWARASYPDAFLKPINKWWDGYDNEEVVIMDDIDPKHNTWIGYFLKMWTDRYAFIGEQKGTSIKIRPKIFLITSQYPIHRVFEDNETIAAIERRCITYNMEDEADVRLLTEKQNALLHLEQYIENNTP